MPAARPGWWRRSRVALVALAVLAPVAILASLSTGAVRSYESRPSRPETVAVGDSGELLGAELRVVDTWTADADSSRGVEYGVPEGTVLLVVTLAVTPVPDGDDEHASYCELRLTAADPERRWNEGNGYTGYYPDRADDAPLSCQLDADAPYRYESVYLVPEDVVGDVVLQALTPAELPRALRFLLAPES